MGLGLSSKEGDDLKFEDFEKFENTVKLIEDTRECVKKTLRRFLSWYLSDEYLIKVSLAMPEK